METRVILTIAQMSCHSYRIRMKKRPYIIQNIGISEYCGRCYNLWRYHRLRNMDNFLLVSESLLALKGVNANVLLPVEMLCTRHGHFNIHMPCLLS